MSDKEQSPRLLSRKDLICFAEHYQFHLFDADLEPEVSVYWDEDCRQSMIFPLDQFVGVGTVRNLEVPVTVEVWSDEPEDADLEEWDQVTECSIDVPSGKIKISGPTEDYYDSEFVELPDTGTYGVRIYYGMLGEVDEEGFEGDDFYRVVLWKSDHVLAPSVVKQWGGTVTYYYQ